MIAPTYKLQRLSPQQSLINHIKAPVPQKQGPESEKVLLPLATGYSD
jgi:hypothetical protein